MSDDFDWYDQYLFHVHATIERYGFFIQYVMGEGDEPSWGYTIGFLAHGHPEVIVVGLDDVSTAGVLHLLYDEIIEGRQRPVGMDHEQELGPDTPIRLLTVPDVHWTDESTRLCTAVQYYGALGWAPAQVAALQLVWAGPSARFPWQVGCPQRFRRLQPVLDPGVGRAA
jgi:hypothetical protein